MDEFLKGLGYKFKFDELNAVEKDTLYTWVDSLQKSELTIPKIKSYISAMKESVEQELTKVSLTAREDIFLKARLRNYMLLEGMLDTPERAKKALDERLKTFEQK